MYLRHLLLLAIVNLSIVAFGQKCEELEDPITGEKKIQFINTQNTLRFENNGAETTDFYTTFIYAGEQNVIMPKGSEIIFKLVNDDIISIKSSKEANPQTRISATQYGASIATYYTFAFELSKEEINKLASAKITFMRYPSTDGGTVDLDVKGRGKVYANKITKGAECLSEHL